MHVNGGCATAMPADLFAPIPNDVLTAASVLEGTRAACPAATAEPPRRQASLLSQETWEGRPSGTGSPHR